MKIWYFPALAIVALAFRYLLLSVSAYEYFWVFKKGNFQAVRIQKVFPRAAQLWNEVKWSLSTFLVFAIGSPFFYSPIVNGRTKLYFHIGDHGWYYFPLSLLILVFAHDTYFYWAHRGMHLKWAFKHIHRVHHLSTNPTPLAAFAFHPLEALIEGGFVASVIFIVPLHPLALILFLVFSHTMNVMGHLGYELFPKGFAKGKILGFINSSTHHNMHHRYFNTNFSLYFNFWDRLLKTNHPNYESTFEDVAQSKTVKKFDGHRHLSVPRGHSLPPT